MPRKRGPAKGKARVKVTSSGKKVSYGQAGKAKGGGARVKPGTSKGDSYCARSLGIKKRLPKSKQNDPNTPNNLSRKRWKCSGAKSRRKQTCHKEEEHTEKLQVAHQPRKRREVLVPAKRKKANDACAKGRRRKTTRNA